MHHRESGHDKLLGRVSAMALLGHEVALRDRITVRGRWSYVCRHADGQVSWEDTIENTVVTVGKNSILDSSRAGSAYTAADYMGLISSSGYSSISAADTMASHAGWTEATSYSGNRKTCAYSAASAGAIALSAGLVFTFTGTDTIKGGFVVGASGASATVSNTGGKLISAGLFTGGDRAVLNADTLTVSLQYSL